MAMLPPYNQIDGIFTTDDKHQDITKAAYDGQARPGQLVIDTLDYQVYVGNADGILNAVGSSGNGTTGGSNTQIQFNDAGNFGGNSALTFDKTTGVTNIAAASVGDLEVTGNVTGDLLPAANITYDLGSPTQRWKDLWLSGTTIQLGPQAISANSSTVIFAGNVQADNYAGDGSAIVNISATNIVGNIPSANEANTANFAGTANFANSVAGANVTGTVGNANVALRSGTVTTAAQPNITSVGTLASLSTAGNVGIGGEVTIANDNGHGGPGYAGIFTLTNSNTSATNPNKFFRLNGSGNLQIVNSAYNATIFDMNDAGKLTLRGGASLGDVGNVTITGGTVGQVLTTDGSGVLSWSTAGGGSYGNVEVAAFLPTYTGNLSGGNILLLGTTSRIDTAGTIAILPSVGNTVDLGNTRLLADIVPLNATGGNVGTAALPFFGANLGNIGGGTLQITGDSQLGDVTVVNSLIGTVTSVIEVQGNSYAKLSSVYTSVIVDPDTVEITVNTGTPHTWTFDDTGNLTLPSNTFAVNYANGTPVSIGGGGSTGDFVFVNTTMSVPDGDRMTIQATDNGIIKSQLIMDGNDDITRLVGSSSQDSNSYDTNDWATGSYASGGYGGEIQFTGATNIIAFFNDNPFASVKFLSVNNGALLPYDGYSGSVNTITFYVDTAPAVDPTTVTTFEIYYQFSSKFEIDYDDGELTIQAVNLDLVLESRGSSSDIEIDSDNRITLRADNTFRLQNSSVVEGITIQTDTDNDERTWTFAADGSLTLPGGAGFAVGDPGYLKVNDTVTTGLDLRDSSGRGFYTNNDGFALRSSGSSTWQYGGPGVLSLPVHTLEPGLNESSSIKSQRTVVEPFRWSAIIAGTTPTVVYTVTSDLIVGFKNTVMVQHSGGGFEMFDVAATRSGGDVFFTVSNRVAPPTTSETTVAVDVNGSSLMQITLTLTSGSSDAWITYNATEFGIAND